MHLENLGGLCWTSHGACTCCVGCARQLLLGLWVCLLLVLVLPLQLWGHVVHLWQVCWVSHGTCTFRVVCVQRLLLWVCWALLL
jgi:hypothetical protein